ncbi:MAG: universal stress protein [Hyphomicrobiaceae bacterium]
MFKHILIATDGSELAQKAIEQGVGLAKALGAKALIVTVTEPWTSVASGDVVFSYPVEEYDKSAAANAAKILASASETAKKQAVACDTVHVRDQYPAEGIVNTASKQACDLIVMASHGRRGLSRMLLGSQANKVVTQSPVPVLICR